MDCTEVISVARIEREAKAAAFAYVSLTAACPYPFASDAGRRFKAAYRLALVETRPVPAAADSVASPSSPTKGTPCHS
jgi:hypothetical protein